MVPLAKMISDSTNGTKAILANDADSAIAAELWVGAAKKAGVKDMVMLTLGTGVGCGVVVNGKMVQGASGMRKIRECGGVVCLEQLVLFSSCRRLERPGVRAPFEFARSPWQSHARALWSESRWC